MKNRNNFLCGYLIIAMLVSFSCQNPKESETEKSEAGKPNILFIAVDDLRPELGVYGAKHIKSPAIDKLSAESLVFDRAYCNIPVCGASRASLLSGIRPGRHRFIGYSTYLDEDYPGVTSLPKHFKNNGYTTISNGKIYHHKDDDKMAWNEVWKPAGALSPRDFASDKNVEIDNTEGKRGYPYENANVPDSAYNDGKIADKTVQDLKKLKEKGEPFFMAVGFLKPHLPFNAPAKYWDLYDSTQISLPENYLQPETTPKAAYHNFGELRHYSGVPKKGPVSDELANKLIHGYYASVSYTDAQIGKLLDALKTLELDQNTIVILWGDHGWNLGDHQLWCKHCNFESSLHVPLILKVPGQTSGKHTSAIAEFIDIYPSLSELAGLPIPEHTDGESLVPLINGLNRTKDFAISKFHDGVTLVKGNLFYTEWLDKEDQVRARMLFDHSNDPLELNNLAESPEFAEKVKEMSSFLHNHWGDDFYVNRKIKKAN
ncbi:sulfatase [Flexithrix dorotheae]|uniref:sulfatase n=1 Tax=Flexithrix dorotheae TaxID=70993 RepID=UPI000475DA0D|nr:sulfatase [Flexithrix dorotheae]